MKRLSLVILPAALVGCLFAISRAQEPGDDSPPPPRREPERSVGPPIRNALPAPPADGETPPARGERVFLEHREGPLSTSRPGSFLIGGGGVGGFIRSTREDKGRERSFDRPEVTAFHKAIEALRSAKDDKQKHDAGTQLRQLLERFFDRDLERREQELSDVEARVKKLREQIEKRKKAKEEIVTLRLKSIANEAEGLGFPLPFGLDGPPDERRYRAPRIDDGPGPGQPRPPGPRPAPPRTGGRPRPVPDRDDPLRGPRPEDPGPRPEPER